ncbi:L,D-transpeptidase [Phormidium sp. CCY1219]|jgi:lipoprotein-anchoring transpeptidase ErfK/SrfK|uniref:L,D-transpeptidase n=1 Tax=Phormidium sp. CCY1219 TaxID=2886104 RepID=UPI002D1E5CFF|nr:L,D-transpeptidase [Phormidium sp. CCY1219]MEB3826512.1 L,D-transpeptidase [Phormidium sp. CCY1219]
MVRGDFLSKRFILLSLSTVFLFSYGSKPAWAENSSSTEVSASNLGTSEFEWVPIPEPELPPLGDYSKFIPFEQLYPGQTPLQTHLVIRLSERRVYLYRNDRLQTSYPIAVGKAGWETPTGSFEVMQMQRDPIWEHPWTGEIVYPGPNNPLGARWIGFWTDGRDFIGFHGTPNEELVGQAVSHGCIRMRNQDILALYSQVDIGTPVTVEP